MKSQPDLSVVIPAFNSAQFVRRALDSCLSQTDVSMEIIVVDDGSVDETSDEVAKVRDERVTMVSLGSNHGVHHARNVGMDRAMGRAIVFLDADDELLTGSLRQCNDVLSRAPEDVGVVYAKGITDRGELTGPRVSETRVLDWPEILCESVFYPTKQCFAAIRSACVGDATWVLQGYDFIFWRTLQARWRTVAIAEPLMRYHTEPRVDRLSAVRHSRESKLNQAPAASAALYRFLEEMKHDLWEFCPKTYGRYLWALSTTSLLSDQRGVAFRAALEGLKRGQRARALAILLLGCAPPSFVRTVYSRL